MKLILEFSAAERHHAHTAQGGLEKEIEPLLQFWKFSKKKKEAHR
jgi:hypothetical protein